jgi:hypothetical protein
MSPAHKGEARFLVSHLQLLARGKRWRTSIISGDVHLAAAGRLYSFPKLQSLERDAAYSMRFLEGGQGVCVMWF